MNQKEEGKMEEKLCNKKKLAEVFEKSCHMKLNFYY